MTVKLFILGQPGSGKSTVARYIPMFAQNLHWFACRYNDNPILQEMFRNDIEGKQFKPADGGGFDVLDLNVFDMALIKLEQKVNKYLLSAKQEEMTLIEFARNDYKNAFNQFSPTFLHDAYFLYLDAQIDICKRRIRDRINTPIYDDDYYVSNYIFDAYYHSDDRHCTFNILVDQFNVDECRVKIIDNNFSFQEVESKINDFVDSIITRESFDKNTAKTPGTLVRVF